MRDIKVKVCAVWDTVASIGYVPRIIPRFWPERLGFVSSSLCPIIQNAFQALALDECRYDFQPVPWSQKNDNQLLKQCWFRGAHSDVGGGNKISGLANLSLAWMASQLRPFVLFSGRKMRDLAMDRQDVLGQINLTLDTNAKRRGFDVQNSMKGFYRLLGSKIRKPGQYDCVERETIHCSVRVLSEPEDSNKGACRALKNYEVSKQGNTYRWTHDGDGGFMEEEIPSVSECQIFEEWWHMEKDIGDARRVLENLRSLRQS